MDYARSWFIRTLAVFLLVWAYDAHAAQKLKDEACLACHGDSTLSEDVGGKQVSLFVDGNKLRHSIHGSMFSCVDCHKDVRSLAHEQPPAKVSCAGCHAEAQQAWAHSTHARASRTGKAPAATCQDCHGSAHGVVLASDPASPVSHANIPATCGRCHGQKFLMELNGESAQPFFSYQDSVHGRAIKNGSENAAVCTDCHGAHEILSAKRPESPIYKFNVPATCGKCHTQIANTLDRKSVV